MLVEEINAAEIFNPELQLSPLGVIDFELNSHKRALQDSKKRMFGERYKHTTKCKRNPT